MTLLFDTSTDNTGLHLKNIYAINMLKHKSGVGMLKTSILFPLRTILTSIKATRVQIIP
jgi:hypothetical protein